MNYRYILDTDHLSLLQRENPILKQRIALVDPDEIAITVVTVEEQLRGWLSVIRRYSQSNNPEKLIWAYMGLRDAVNYISQFQVVELTLEAYNLFVELRQQGVRIGTQDLRIAAITLSQQVTLVTRNQRDFSQVPNLMFEDWTRPS
ncbi:type II toxin-antitoxin system VapC family toxin [Capilliphycus salinus ALCB114379]|uniref:type II toxin-antitoxin system VapC family toxin n=1 Tax=Capilliphycus salinus TaxID=2768948 RepID=UPI0039A5394F